MKRIFIFIKMIFVLPTMFFSRLHAQKLSLHDKHQVAKIWANFIIRNLAINLEIKNTNMIPLEDGYTFIANHDSKYDGILLLASNPLVFSFFIRFEEHLPYMTSFLNLIESIRYTAITKEDDLILMSQALTNQRNFQMYLNDLSLKDTDSTDLNAAFLTKTAIIPVAIKNSAALMRYGQQNIIVTFCTPLHYEEYGTLGPIETLNEIKRRLNNELKQGG